MAPLRDLRAIREKGQVWTPAWVAERMVEWVLDGGAAEIFDPAVGEGAFLLAARAFEARATAARSPVRLSGVELDPAALERAALELGRTDLQRVERRDFLCGIEPAGVRGGGAEVAHRHLVRLHDAIVANPPYIRHHRLPRARKVALGEWAAQTIGARLDGRAGLHIYFLVRALELLAPGGRLAFIMPADTCEGVFAPVLWRWITGRFRLEAVTTFAPGASPFPAVDTNAVIFFIQNQPPLPSIVWERCLASGADLAWWRRSETRSAAANGVESMHRSLDEALATGLSRPPAVVAEAAARRGRRAGGREPAPDATLGEYACVRRGIATGANEFFFLTRKRASDLGIGERFLVSAIGRTRDVDGDVLTGRMLDALDRRGRPTWLLNIDGASREELPARVGEYLVSGEKAGFPVRALISTRRPWYRMERREPPPILFAYLGRRNARFIRNEAAVVPLTGFLCIYPRRRDRAFVEALWQVLREPATVANLARVGKSYGGGAIKVEPRALERLPLPAAALERAGLSGRRAGPSNARAEETALLPGEEPLTGTPDSPTGTPDPGIPRTPSGRRRRSRPA